jgi:hypothetical protein
MRILAANIILLAVVVVSTTKAEITRKDDPFRQQPGPQRIRKHLFLPFLHEKRPPMQPTTAKSDDEGPPEWVYPAVKEHFPLRKAPYKSIAEVFANMRDFEQNGIQRPRPQATRRATSRPRSRQPQMDIFEDAGDWIEVLQWRWENSPKNAGNLLTTKISIFFHFQGSWPYCRRGGRPSIGEGWQMDGSEGEESRRMVKGICKLKKYFLHFYTIQFQGSSQRRWRVGAPCSG